MKNLLSFILISCITAAFAQTAPPLTTKDVINIQSMPYYSYGDGLGVTSRDSLYSVNFRFRMQNRISYVEDDGEDAKYEAQIRRLRMRVEGYVINPKFLYVIQLGFSPTDIGVVEDNSYTKVVRDAMIIYQPNERWNFGFGQTKLPGNRQRLNSSGALQLTDRSINNAQFNNDRDFGLHINNFNQFSDKFSYNLKGAISTGEGRAVTSTPDDGLALTGRVELFPLGSFQKNGAFFEGDLFREKTPKMMVSATFQQSNKAQYTQGQLGDPLFDPRTMQSLFLDGIVKYNGWAAMVAYMSRTTDDSALTFNPIDNTDIRYVYTGYGTDYQLSYNFPSNYEIAARYSNQQVSKEIFQFTPNRDQYSLGVTRYIWEHAFKLQGEVTWDELHFNDGSQKQNWYVRFQIEIGI